MLQVTEALRELLLALDAANESRGSEVAPEEMDLLAEVERVANETVEATRSFLSPPPCAQGGSSGPGANPSLCVFSPSPRL